MKPPALLSVTAASLVLLSSMPVGAAGEYPASRNGLTPPGASATPFGGVRRPGQDGVRPGDLRRPSANPCASSVQPPASVPGLRRDPSGRVQVTGAPASGTARSGNIYSCASDAGKIRANAGAGRAKSAYNARTNTLNAATDGYVNRSATSSMMPRKTPSMYDPATGTLKPRSRPSAYDIYQR